MTCVHWKRPAMRRRSCKSFQRLVNSDYYLSLVLNLTISSITLLLLILEKLDLRCAHAHLPSICKVIVRHKLPRNLWLKQCSNWPILFVRKMNTHLFFFLYAFFSDCWRSWSWKQKRLFRALEGNGTTYEPAKLCECSEISWSIILW